MKKLSPVTAGVKSDFDTLLSKFKEAETVRYEKFAEIWKNMRMSLFCSGRQNERIIQEFMEECFVIATKYLTSTADLQVRVFGLYLLYGLYVTQPCIPKVKIRILPQQWQSLKALQEELHEQQHFDVECVLHKLRYMRVFYCVITETDVWSGMSDKNEPSISGITDTIKHSDAVEEIIDNDFIEQLASIHDQYYKTKCALSGSQKPNRSLDVIHAEIMDSINFVVGQHEEKKSNMKRQARSAVSSDVIDVDDLLSDNKEKDPDFKPNQSVGQIRSKIRARAFAQVRHGRKLSRLKKTEAELSPKKQSKRNKLHSVSNLDNSDAAGSSSPDKKPEKSVIKKPRGRQKNLNLFYGFPEIETQMSSIGTDGSLESSADEATANLLDMMIISTDDNESVPAAKRKGKTAKKVGRPRKDVKAEGNDTASSSSPAKRTVKIKKKAKQKIPKKMNNKIQKKAKEKILKKANEKVQKKANQKKGQRKSGKMSNKT